MRLKIDRGKLRRRFMIAQLIAAPVGLVVLAWLLTRELSLERLRAHWIGIGASIAIGLLGLELFGYRLFVIARMFGLRVSRRAVGRIHVVTMFYYFFLPTGIGYDLVRVAKLGIQSEEFDGVRLAGIASVERLAGGIGLLILCFIALPFTELTDRNELPWLDLAPWVGPTVVALVLLVTVLTHVLGRHRFPRIRLVYPATAVSALAYTVLAAGLWLAAWALFIPVGPFEILVALGGTQLFQLIPVNLVGVSLGEVAAVAIYMAYGLERPDAVLMVTLAYLQRLAAALVGGGVEAVHSARWLMQTSSLTPRQHPSE